jgi:hypothetical protein
MKKAIILSLLLLFFILNFLSAQRESLTYDEQVHLKAGIEEWQTRIFSLDANNPPLIREIAALPILFGAGRLISSPFPAHQYFPARMTIIILSLILAGVVFWYVKKHIGWTAGLLSLFFFVFEPNLLAHSHYVTLDLGTTLFFVLAYFSFLNFLETTSLKNGLIWGLFLGLALASKVTIIPALAISFLIAAWIKKKIFKPTFWKKAFLGIIGSLLIVWATYFFTFAPIIAERHDPTRLSERILAFADEKNYSFLKSIIFFLKGKPIPLGYYLATLKNGLVYNLRPHEVEFLGRFYPNNRFWFLPVIIALKTPLPLLILFLAGIFLALRKKKKPIFFVLMPVFFMILFFSLSNVQTRLRYSLPIYPFMIIVAAFAAEWLSKKHLGKIILGLLFAWYFLGTIFSFPHFISYANEIAGPKEKRIFLFSDSDYDWGQSLFGLKKYVEKENIASVKLSYCGTDNPAEYGLVADRPFAERFEDRCPLYQIKLKEEGKKIIAISLTNYYYCGYYQQSEFSKNKVSEIIGDSILVFK